ncbi:MAG TPA: hypothetical protein VIT38_04585 [Allosphingosinicella sp.]|jgi:hypothetical protein
MAVSTIDGTIEEAVIKSSRMNLRVYKQIRFRLRDGSETIVAKPIADAKVAALLQPGTSGRFYMFKAPDHKGFHGVRDDQGHAVYEFPRNNEKLMLIVMIVATIVSGLLLTFGLFSGWMIIALGISIPFYFILKSLRTKAQQQYDSDGGYRPPDVAAQPAAAS